MPLRWGDRVGIGASRLSRRLGRSGGIIAGRIALATDKAALQRLAADAQAVLVSGTNGKSTTTVMLADAWSRTVEVASNIGGANMPDGLVAALLDRPGSRHAVLEVDEPHLPGVLGQVYPDVVVLLNLTRDQLDRVGETWRLADRIQRGLAAHPDTVVVANADDPNVVWAARTAGRRVWVSAGAAWTGDSMTCPHCGDLLWREARRWGCAQCGLSRPDPHWELHDDRLAGPAGQDLVLRPGLPGAMNRSNAAFVVAAADVLGVSQCAAMAAIEEIREVHGRYRIVERHPHRVRLLLAKNPAGWQQMLELLAVGKAPIVLAVNARQADGRDPSWLWDVPFEQLAGRELVAVGERAEDVSVRLTYAGLTHRVAADPEAGLELLAAGPVDLIGDYTSLLDTASLLRRGLR